MTLAARQADLSTAITDLKALVVNCNTDIAAADVDTFEINRLRDRGQAALVALGLANWANQE